jgi:hypothetical protein
MTVNHRRWFAYEMAFGAQRPGEAFAVAPLHAGPALSQKLRHCPGWRLSKGNGAPTGIPGVPEQTS